MFIDELRSGDAVDQGSFRLDEERAREKLRNFQLANPHYYVLEFVKAAQLLGASWIWFSIDANELTMNFDGQRLTPAELKALYSAAFLRRMDFRQRALRHLAVGVNAAHAIGVSEFNIEVGGQQRHGVELSGEEVVPLESVAEGVTGTRIYLRKRVNPTLLLRFVDDLWDRLPEAEVLRERGVYSSIPIKIDGEQISFGISLPGHIRSPMKFEHRAERGQVGINFDNQHVITDVLQHGVLVGRDTRSGHFGEIGVRAVVESPRLTLNLSHSAFVEDRAWEALQRRVDDVAMLSLLTAVGELNAVEVRKRRPTLKQMAIELFSVFSYRESAEEVIETAVGLVEDLPIFERADRRWDHPLSHTSIADIRTVEDGETTIRYSRRQFDDLSDVGHVLLMNFRQPREKRRDFEPGGLLRYFADQVIDVTEQLVTAEEREKNRRIWLARPRVSAKVELESSRRRSVGTWEVMAGMQRHGIGAGMPDRAIIRYIKDGRLLSQKKLNSKIPSFYVEIAGDIEANELFDGPADTDELHAAHAEAARLFSEALAELDFSLDLLGAMLGRFQEELERAFGWQVDDWPQDVVDGPLGIAPALLGPAADSEFEEKVGAQITRLGEMAESPIIEDLDGDKYSLQDIYGLLCDESANQDIYLVDNGRYITQSAGDEEVMLVVGQRNQWVLSHFFAGRLLELFGQGEAGEGRQKPKSDIDAVVAELFGEGENEDSGDGDREIGPRFRRNRSARKECATELVSRLVGEAGGERTGDVVDESSSEGIRSRGGDRVYARHLVDRVGSHGGDHLAACIDRISAIEVIYEGGKEPVYLLGSGERLVLDREHPIIDAAYSDRLDGVAHAFADLAIYTALTGYARDHGLDSATRREIVARKRRFLHSLNMYLSQTFFIE